MSKTVYGHRLKPWIAEDNFLEIPHRRITVVCCLNIGGKNSSKVWNLLQKLDCFCLTQRFKVSLVNTFLNSVWQGSGTSTRSRSNLCRYKTMTQSTTNLYRELIVQSINEITYVIGDIPEMKILSTPISGRAFPP